MSRHVVQNLHQTTHYKLTDMCRLLGYSRSWYYKSSTRKAVMEMEAQWIVNRVKEIREDHPRIGTRKLYSMLADFRSSAQIKMGRDAFFSLLGERKLLIKKKRRSMRTTNSVHGFRKYPDLRKELTVDRKNQLWVSDITYWKPGSKFLYINFITDAYSHKIVGYHLAKTMKVVENLRSLKMALKDLATEDCKQTNLIHHSDRGFQYCAYQYVKKLRNQGIKISMTESSDPRDNAVAERINGIIKNEYLYKIRTDDFNAARKAVDEAVKLYNEHRPHLSIGMLTPSELHDNEQLRFKKLWKTYYSNYDAPKEQACKRAQRNISLSSEEMSHCFADRPKNM